MRYNELKWEHLAQVTRHLRTTLGVAVVDAAKQAGIPPGVWNRVRRSWDELPGHLATVDPDGTKVDLQALNNLIQAGRSKGGRPLGSKNMNSGTGRGSQAALPALIVKNPGFYVEDGIIEFDGPEDE